MITIYCFLVPVWSLFNFVNFFPPFLSLFSVAPIVVMEPRAGLVVNESEPMVSIYCTYTANPSGLLENETVWFKDGRVLDTSTGVPGHYSTSVASYPILTIRNVGRADSGHYYCSTANQLGAGVPDSAVFLNVLYAPTARLTVVPDPSGSVDPNLIKEGIELRMVCEVVEGNPRNATRMRWLKDGQLMSELEGETAERAKTLTQNGITRELTGNYSCVAVSEAGASRPSNSVPVVVRYPPGKALVRLLNEPYPVKGENLSLECIVGDRGRPSDSTEYHWVNADGQTFESRGPVLRINGLRLVNRGNISCAAVNEVGFGPAGVFELIPYAPPRFINPLPATIGVNENLEKNGGQGGGGTSAAESQRSQSTDEEHYRYDVLPPEGPEGVSNGPHKNGGKSSSSTMSVYCRVECYPLCSITWYRNEVPVENGTDGHLVVTTVQPEEFLLNRFPSVLSTLTWNITASSGSSSSGSGGRHLDRVRDSGTIYSCVSSENMVGPSVRSDTRFQVECKCKPLFSLFYFFSLGFGFYFLLCFTVLSLSHSVQ